MENPKNIEFLLAVTAVLFLALQYLYRVWDKKDNRSIIDALTLNTEATLKAIRTGVESFQPQVERTQRIKGMLGELIDIHRATDGDGRPMVYMPKEIIETQREMVRLMNTVATTQTQVIAAQAQTARLIEKFEESVSVGQQRMEALLTVHGDACRGQFHELDKSIREKTK